MALRLRRLFKFDRNIPAMMDIAANDGCLMKEFRKAGFIVFGVEPSKDLAGKPDFENTLVIVNDFWSHKLSKRWSDMGKHRDVITATNVLAHVDDIHDFLLGVKEMLLEKGVFVAEVPYLVNLIEGIQFDTIYHEHLSYFLLKPLLRVFKDCGLEIFKVERYPIHGGSIRIYAGHKGKHKVCKSVSKTLENEKRLGFHSLKRYLGFKENVEELRASITSQIISLHIYHKRIACYGASAKGINLLNYCGLSHRLISYVVDDTPEKVGKFIPSMRIPIVSFERFIHDRPDYIMLLAWNFKAELIEKTKHLQVKYIVPVPKVELL
jgi:SAM-dependent methyltransferase